MTLGGHELEAVQLERQARAEMPVEEAQRELYPDFLAPNDPQLWGRPQHAHTPCLHLPHHSFLLWGPPHTAFAEEKGHSPWQVFPEAAATTEIHFEKSVLIKPQP